ncbi:MAG: hypothetical protein UV87_C0003G0015 [candidate division WWE3 bacterium GW2011_GWD1_43_201]|nr:MAG: hypothetical protein UV87_C0003G0015 [candidate division WWE3 bacterium GW2011_GWD1_43_201]
MQGVSQKAYLLVEFSPWGHHEQVLHRATRGEGSVRVILARERTNFSCIRQFCERSEWNCFDGVKIPRGVTRKAGTTLW